MFRILLVLLWLPLAGYAQTYPAPLSDTVSDYAGLLPPEAEARVAAALQAARDETGVHIALATIGAQAEYGGTGRFADFATGWFNFWGIGDATRNDGILILVARDDREMRIALGRAYGVIWDGRAQRVIDTAMLPAFRKDEYAKGLEDGALMAIAQLARPFAANETVTQDSGFPQKSFADRIMPWILGAIFTTVFAVVIFSKRLVAFVKSWERCPTCGKRNLESERRVTLSPTENTGGRGVAYRRCRFCDYERGAPFTTPSFSAARRRKSRSSSGFGGGSSGGGGASGKW